MGIRVRFAPSPSGDLHVGNARTALFNYLYARKRAGTFVLRIEDSDADRCDEASVRGILESLAWLGLAPDEGEGPGGPHAPYRQSRALDLYRSAAQVLLDAGRAYWCYDTPEEMEAERQRALDFPGEPKRRHPHRGLDAAARAVLEAQGRRPALRFATDDLEGHAAWVDGVRGEVRFDLREIRDFNLLKSDGTPMYNWACVVDDHRMGITHVLRGEDGISNTPRQLLLDQALGWSPPEFSHVAFILGPDGQKLSKRHGDTGVRALRGRGYLPEALLNYLGLLGLGGEGEGAEVFTLDDLVGRFEPDRLVKKASVFDFGKLDFLNAHWLRSKTGAELAVLASPFLEGLEAEAGWRERALDIFKGNAVVLKDLRAPLEALLGPPEPSARAVAAGRSFGRAADALRAAAQGLQSWAGGEDAAKAALKRAQALGGVRGREFFVPLRLALTGEEHGPELPKILDLLGPPKTLARLAAFTDALAGA